MSMIMKNYTFILFLLISILSCSAKFKKKYLIGKWNVINIQINGQDIEDPKELFKKSYQNSYLNFIQDGTFNGFLIGVEQKGTWNIDSAMTILSIMPEEGKIKEVSYDFSIIGEDTIQIEVRDYEPLTFILTREIVENQDFKTLSNNPEKLLVGKWDIFSSKTSDAYAKVLTEDLQFTYEKMIEEGYFEFFEENHVFLNLNGELGGGIWRISEENQSVVLDFKSEDRMKLHFLEITKHQIILDWKFDGLTIFTLTLIPSD